MIIKATRIKAASGAGAVAAHVLRGDANEEITVLQGSEADLHAAARDAIAAGRTYALRHYALSPGEAATRQDAEAILADLGAEFRFDPGAAMLVEHRKPRAGGRGHDTHWHALVPEVDPVSGRVLSSSWMRPRHERVARIAEARLGHALVPGRWNAAVARALQADGRHDLAARVSAAAALPRPEGSYTSQRQQAAARRGVSLPAARAAVAAAWRASDSPAALRAALAEQGIALREGDKPGVWIAEQGGTLLGALHRLAGVRVGEVRGRMAAPEPEAPQLASGPAPTTPEAPAAPAPALAEAAPPPVAAPVAGGIPIALPTPSGAVDPVSEAPNPARRAPQAAGGASSRGGADDLIAPLDPSKPGDAARFLTQWAARERRRAAAAAAASQHGRPATPAGGGLLAGILARWAAAYGPEQAAAWRPHAERLARHLATDAITRATAALARGDHEARRILAGAPPRAPAAVEVEARLRGEIEQQITAARKAAEAAARRVDEARRRGGLAARLPWTDATQQVQAAELAAEQARRHLGHAEAGAPLRRQLAPEQARGEVAEARRERARWEARPDVQEARERRRLDAAITARIAAGDHDLAALAAADLAAAREVIRQQEEAARRTAEERQREQEREQRRRLAREARRQAEQEATLPAPGAGLAYRPGVSAGQQGRPARR
ncbi:hypothetical protein VQH23_26500 (plasmid) [Pararoseomonas sp. SCSIO 73927]|uniref:hypothetical protein n=1 Tax=Pararoseomonas sp. SCSIO 73927 TaxID=3114537 RepID=UPI0030CAE9C2